MLLKLKNKLQQMRLKFSKKLRTLISVLIQNNEIKVIFQSWLAKLQETTVYHNSAVAHCEH